MCLCVSLTTRTVLLLNLIIISNILLFFSIFLNIQIGSAQSEMIFCSSDVEQKFILH